MRATADSPPIGRDDHPDTGPAAQQTIVRSVATAGRPATTAARSVFDMARPPTGRGGARTQLPALLPKDLKFEADVPLPKRAGGGERGKSKYAALFEGLQVGHSVELPISYEGTLNSQAKKVAKASTDGRKYVVRKMNATHCRIWRTA